MKYCRQCRVFAHKDLTRCPLCGSYLVGAEKAESPPASRYELCVVVAKRARQVIDQAQNQGIKELPDKMKEIAFACREIESGKLSLTRD